MPGHERFVRTMVSGATGIDAVLLVVDAGEGVMPQTREHIDIAALLGVRRAIVAVSRIDLADAAQVAATVRPRRALVRQAGLQAGRPSRCRPAPGRGWTRCARGAAALSQPARRRMTASPTCRWTGRSPCPATARW